MVNPILNSLVCTMITVGCYMAGVALFRKFNKSWLNPLYTVTGMIMCLLAIFHVDYENYSAGCNVFSFFLGTATVSLAVPLYKQIQTLKRHLPLVLASVTGGTLAGILSVLLLAKEMGLGDNVIFSLLPKSVTAPVALSISQSLGGVPSLTVLFVTLSAIFSLLTGPALLKLGRIRSGIAKGLALGISAQVLGVSRALEWGEVEGAMGSVAISLSALLMTVFTPFLFYF